MIMIILFASLYIPGCTDLIMDDAKKKKDEWMQRLRSYEVESLLSLRDALLARGTMLTMSTADIKDIVRDIKTTVSKDSLALIYISHFFCLPSLTHGIAS